MDKSKSWFFLLFCTCLFCILINTENVPAAGGSFCGNQRGFARLNSTDFLEEHSKLKKIFFYKALFDVATFKKKHPFAGGIVGSAGIKIHAEQSLEGINDLDLLIDSKENADHLINLIYNDFLKYTVENCVDQPLGVNKHNISSVEGRVAYTNAIGGVTVFYSGLPLATIEISVFNDDMKTLEFSDKNVFTKANTLAQKPLCSVPLLTLASYIAMDTISFEKGLTKLKTAPKENEDIAIKELVYLCQSLKKTQQRVSLYRQLNKRENYQGQLKKLANLYNQLLDKVKSNKHLLPALYKKASFIQHEKSKLRQNNKKETQEMLQILLQDDFILTHPAKGTSNLFDCLADLLNANDYSYQQFIAVANHFMPNLFYNRENQLIVASDISYLISSSPLKMPLINQLTKEQQAPLCDHNAYYGNSPALLTHLFKVLALSTGMQFILLEPDWEKGILKKEVYNQKRMIKEMVNVSDEDQTLIAQCTDQAEHLSVIENTHVVMHLGNGNYNACSPRTTLLKRLKPLKETEKLIRFGQTIDLTPLSHKSHLYNPQWVDVDDSIEFKTLKPTPPESEPFSFDNSGSLFVTENKESKKKLKQSASNSKQTSNSVKIHDPLSKTEQEINKKISTIDLSKKKGLSLNSAVKEKYANDLFNDIVQLICHHSQPLSAIPNKIKVDFNKVNGVAKNGLLLACELGHASAAIILGVENLSNCSREKPLDIDDVLSSIHYFTLAAEKGNIQGPLCLYWLANITGLPEPLYASIKGIDHLDPIAPKGNHKIIEFTFSADKQFLCDAYQNETMPIIVKKLALGRKTNCYFEALTELDKKAPRVMDVEQQLLPTLLFSDLQLNASQADIESTLVYLTHEGCSYMNRENTGEDEKKARRCFMQAAIAYSYLCRINKQNDLPPIVKASGLLSVYQSCYFCHQEMENRQYNLASVLPDAFDDFSPYLSTIIKRMVSLGSHQYIYNVLAKMKVMRHHWFAITASNLTYIDQMLKSQPSALMKWEEIMNQAATRNAYLSTLVFPVAAPEKSHHHPSIPRQTMPVTSILKKNNAVSQAVKKNVRLQSTKGISKKYTHKKVTVMGTQINEIKDEIYDLCDKYQAESVDKNEKQLICEKYFYPTLTLIEKIASLINNDKTLLENQVDKGYQESVLQCNLDILFRATSAAFLVLTETVIPGSLSEQGLRNIITIQNHLMTHRRAESALTKKWASYKKIYNAVKTGFISLLSAQNFETFNDEIALLLCDSFFNHCHLFPDELFCNNRENVFFILQQIIDLHDDYSFMEAALNIMARLNFNFSTYANRNLLVKALEKYYLSISINVMIDEQQPFLEKICSYLRKINLDNDNQLLTTWENRLTEHSRDLEKILQDEFNYSDQAWMDIMAEEKRKHDEKQEELAKIRHKQQLERKAAIIEQQNDNQDMTTDSESEDSDNTDDIIYEINDSPIEVKPEYPESLPDDDFITVYKLISKNKLNRAIDLLKRMESKQDTDSFYLARVLMVKSDCLIEKLKKKHPLFTQVNRELLKLKNYKMQIELADSKGVYPHVTKTHMKLSGKKIGDLTAGLHKKNHILKQAIAAQQSSIDILKLLLGGQIGLESSICSTASCELEMLMIQHSFCSDLFNRLLEVCDVFETTLKARGHLITRLNKKRQLLLPSDCSLRITVNPHEQTSEKNTPPDPHLNHPFTTHSKANSNALDVPSLLNEVKEARKQVIKYISKLANEDDLSTIITSIQKAYGQ